MAATRHDPEAFGEFYDAHARRVLAYFTRRVGDREVALDLTAESFAHALEHHGQFRGSSVDEEIAWLFSIARTQLALYWRHGDIERRALERLGVTVPIWSSDDLDRVEELVSLELSSPVLQRALTSLPVAQRSAVEMRCVDELSYARIASVQGVSEQSARARVSRGLRGLAAWLDAIAATSVGRAERS